jgi:hypothetical protein
MSRFTIIHVILHPTNSRLAIQFIHIARTKFEQLGILSKKFQTHFAFSLAMSKATSSNSIIDLVMHVCLEDFQKTAPLIVKINPLIDFESLVLNIKLVSVYPSNITRYFV